MNKFSERMREAMELRDLKQIDIVKKTGIDKGTISHYLKGDYEPKGFNFDKIALELDVNDAWLAGYDAPMERQHGDLVFDFDKKMESWESEYYSRDFPSYERSEEVTREELDLLTAYRDSDVTIQKAVRKLLDIEDPS